MKFNLKSLVVAAAFVAAGGANAADLTLNVGESITAAGWTVSGLNGTGTLTFSGDPFSGLVGALNAGSVMVDPIAPATGDIVGSLAEGGYQKVAVAAVVTSLTGSFDGTNVSISSVGTAGGAQQTSFADDFTNTGGDLAIQNLRVDLGAKVVYADLFGGNGVGLKAGVALWNIGQIDGPTTFSVFDAVDGVVTAKNTLSQLTITDEAFGYFIDSLGIIEGGYDVLKGISDYGTITSTISVNVTAVPEPSTYALMGVGLVGLGLMSRRRAK